MRSTSLAAGAAVALAVAAAGAAPAAASAPDRAPGTPMCTAKQLSAALGGGDAGAGHVYKYLVLTNTGSTTCHLTGYPGVSLLDSAGKQIGKPADRQPSRYSPVVLKPGASASDTIHTINHMGTCQAPSASIRVYPPGNTESLVIPGEITVCDATFTITPLAPGKGGSDPVAPSGPAHSASPSAPASSGGQVSTVPKGAPDTGLAEPASSGDDGLVVGLAAGAAALALGGAGAAAARRRGRARD
jgi:hypothetical protein